MKYKIGLLLLIYTLISFKLYAQETYNVLQNKVKQHRNNPDSLAFYANELYNISKQKNDTRVILNALMALGSAETRKGKLQKSNGYYHKLINVANNNEMSSFGYGAMTNIALNHRRLQRNDSAFYYFKKVNSFYSDNDFKISAAQAKMNLGISYFQYQELDSAYYFLRLSQKGFKELKNQRLLATNQSLLAEIYYQKENYSKAIEQADSSLIISKTINFKPNLSRNYSLLSRSYEKLGHLPKARNYALLEEQNMVKRPENTGVGRLNEKYETEARERRFSNLEKVDNDKKFYQSNFFFITTICLFFLGLSFVLLRKNRLTKQEILELQLLVDNDSELHAKVRKSETKNNIVLKSNSIINFKEILYIKSDGHYIDYFIEDKSKPEIERNSLTKALTELPEKLFIRTHRSYVVNVQRIKIINSTQLMLDTGEWIPLSRTYKSGLKELLNKK